MYPKKQTTRTPFKVKVRKWPIEYFKVKVRKLPIEYFIAVSWWEQTTLRWDDVVLDQHVILDLDDVVLDQHVILDLDEVVLDQHVILDLDDTVLDQHVILDLDDAVLDQHVILDFSSGSSLKQQFTDWHVTPLGHLVIICSNSLNDICA
jgi:hypothetical protein